MSSNITNFLNCIRLVPVVSLAIRGAAPRASWRSTRPVCARRWQKLQVASARSMWMRKPTVELGWFGMWIFCEAICDFWFPEPETKDLYGRNHLSFKPPFFNQSLVALDRSGWSPWEVLELQPLKPQAASRGRWEKLRSFLRDLATFIFGKIGNYERFHDLDASRHDSSLKEVILCFWRICLKGTSMDLGLASYSTYWLLNDTKCSERFIMIRLSSPKLDIVILNQVWTMRKMCLWTSPLGLFDFSQKNPSFMRTSIDPLSIFRRTANNSPGLLWSQPGIDGEASRSSFEARDGSVKCASVSFWLIFK